MSVATLPANSSHIGEPDFRVFVTDTRARAVTVLVTFISGVATVAPSVLSALISRGIVNG
jgi:hypothetical protein